MDTEPPNAVAHAGPAPHVAARRPAPPDFITFYRASYKDVIKAASSTGATLEQADEATAKAMEEVLRRWGQITDPVAYAKRAAISNFLKDKTRSTDRVRRRMVEQSAHPDLEGDDPGLTVWENREWVLQMLRSLPPRLRDAMALWADGFEPKEIAVVLGRTPEAIRQRLFAARERLRQRHQQELRDSRGPERSASAPTKEVRP